MGNDNVGCKTCSFSCNAALKAASPLIVFVSKSEIRDEHWQSCHGRPHMLNLDPLPLASRHILHRHGNDVVATGRKCRREKLELSWKILMDEEDVQ